MRHAVQSKLGAAMGFLLAIGCGAVGCGGRAVRGGDFNGVIEFLLSSDRDFGGPPSNRNLNGGARCARTR
jgi:hypothetical protein